VATVHIGTYSQGPVVKLSNVEPALLPFRAKFASMDFLYLTIAHDERDWGRKSGKADHGLAVAPPAPLA
jgi:hypothetical protein